jgi:hypothetical protein
MAHKPIPHKVGVISNEDGASIGFEERGLDRLYFSFDNQSAGPLLPLKAFDVLVEKARAELKTEQEQSDIDILDATANNPKAMLDAFKAWLADIARRKFLFSRVRRAAQFLAAQQILMINFQYSARELSNEDAALARMKSACFFADAWYYWRREIFGDHELACHGMAMAENRSKGPQTRSAKAQKKQALIVETLRTLIDGKDSSQKIARNNRKRVNAVLDAAGVKRLFKTDTALEKALQLIRADRKEAARG